VSSVQRLTPRLSFRPISGLSRFQELIWGPSSTPPSLPPSAVTCIPSSTPPSRLSFLPLAAADIAMSDVFEDVRREGGREGEREGGKEGISRPMVVFTFLLQSALPISSYPYAHGPYFASSSATSGVS